LNIEVDMDPVLVSLLTVIGSGIAAYLGSYLKAKGKNLASKEDVQDVVKQVQTITQATKEIEAKISDKMWDRQKHWELKRDVLFTAMKNVTECDVALRNFNSQPKVEEESWLAAARKLDETNLLIAVTCSSEMNLAYDAYVVFANSVANKIFTRDKQIYPNSEEKLEDRLVLVRAAVRKELGIDCAS
jgi:hypothetical protein